jgi:hypothetical protein
MIAEQMVIDDVSTGVERVHIARLYLRTTPFCEKGLLKTGQDRWRGIGALRCKRLKLKRNRTTTTSGHVLIANHLHCVWACAAQE